MNYQKNTIYNKIRINSNKRNNVHFPHINLINL